MTCLGLKFLKIIKIHLALILQQTIFVVLHEISMSFIETHRKFEINGVHVLIQVNKPYDSYIKDSTKEHFSQLWYFLQATLPRDLVSIVSPKLFLDYKTSQLFGHVVSSFLPSFFSFFFFALPFKINHNIGQDISTDMMLCDSKCSVYLSILPDFLWGDNWRVSIFKEMKSISPPDHHSLAVRPWEVCGSPVSSEMISITRVLVGVCSCCQRNPFQLKISAQQTNGFLDFKMTLFFGISYHRKIEEKRLVCL